VFRVRRAGVDTFSEHVFFIHHAAVEEGALGLKPLDRVRVIGYDPVSGERREIEGILNFCRGHLAEVNEISLSEAAFGDLGLPEGAEVRASLARPPESIALVRGKLAGRRFERRDLDAILADVVRRRYSKVELSMFVLACALRRLDDEELTDLTRAMIGTGVQLDFGPGPIADKHSIGGIPGNRTTMIVVPILASLGVTVPKTSSRAITSSAGTADTMGVLAQVALGHDRLHDVVSETGGCIAWGGALEMAPADDVLITVERPMGIDTEAQMIASIVSKKKAAGATHAVIDIPVGPSAKVRTRRAALELAGRFERVASALDLCVEIVATDAIGPIGTGVGPRLEALDVLAVLRGEPDAPVDLREKSLYLAARILEAVGAMPPVEGYAAARRALDSGAAARKFDEIVAAQGARELPAEAAFRALVASKSDGRLRHIDCAEINTLAKLAGAPVHPASGLRVLRKPGDVVMRGDPLLEIHAQTEVQLEFATDYARQHPSIHQFGY
jgi:thymidine phosphorylase